MTELEKYQAFHQHIRQRKAEIPAELEALRQAREKQDRPVPGAPGGETHSRDDPDPVALRRTGGIK